MSKDRDAHVLRHIIGYCEQIADTVARFGNSYANFESDAIYRNAAALPVLQIGELTTHLSEDFKETHKGIPWTKIKALRNIVAHHYGKIDSESLWETITQDVPGLNQYCQTILQGPTFSQIEDDTQVFPIK